MRTYGRYGDLAIAAAAALVLPLLSGFPLLFLRDAGNSIDPLGYWFPHLVQQITQAGLTVLSMLLVSRVALSEWGFNLRDWQTSLTATLVFSVIWLMPAWLLVIISPAPATGIGSGAMVAVLLSHFVVMGFTQEILFRGFVMTLLRTHWGKAWSWRGWSLSQAGIIATLLFMLAHVKFQPPYVIWWQQLASALLGLYYAVLFERTRSLLGPSLSHNYSNGAYVALLIARYTPR